MSVPIVKVNRLGYNSILFQIHTAECGVETWDNINNFPEG